jgi:hypothetical protein
VTDIRLTNDPDLNRSIRMTLQVDREHLAASRRIPNWASARRACWGRSSSISGAASPSESLKDGGEIKARDDRDFLEIVQSAMPLLESVQSILNRLDKIVAIVERGEGPSAS